MSYVDIDIGNGVRRRTISGADSIEDTCTQGGGGTSPLNNWGGTTGLSVWHFAGSPAYFTTLIRLKNISDLPLGNIVSFKQSAYSGNCPNRTAKFFLIKPENSWAEGASSGTEELGSSCNRYCVNPSLQWAGLISLNTTAWGLGGGTIDGVDYYSDSNPPVFYGANSNVNVVTELRPEWIIGWRNNLYINNGIVLIQTEAQSGGISLFSVEHGTFPQSFTIDYIPSGKGKLIKLF